MKYSIFFLFCSTILFAQRNNMYSSVEKTMKIIPQNESKASKDIAHYIKKHFTNQEEQIKAAYYYVISNLSYDVKNEFTVNLIITEEDMVAKAITTKKGVCIHYARFFNDIVTQLGYRCHVVSGYTKKSNNTIAELSHAWCAVKMSDEKWYIFDPTWDSGYLLNGNFVRRLNSKYYKLLPIQSIKTHMPFDYIWQFLNFPINENQFASNNHASQHNQVSFDYDQAIDNYLILSEENQLQELKKRMNQTGHESKLAQERFDLLTKQIAVFDTNQNIKKYNQISEEFNKAVNLLNEFILYRNAQFKPEKQNHVILHMIDEPLEIFEKCNNEIYKIGFVGQDNLYGLNKFKITLFDVINDTKQHKQFVLDYIKSNKRDRKKMFETKKLKVTF